MGRAARPRAPLLRLAGVLALLLIAGCARPASSPAASSGAASTDAATPRSLLPAVPASAAPSTGAATTGAASASAATGAPTAAPAAVTTTAAVNPATGSAPAATDTPTPAATAAPTATAPPAPTGTTTPVALAAADRSAWDGATLALQSGTTATLTVPAPAAADDGQVPAVSAEGLPAPTALALPEGLVALRLTVPSGASGLAALTMRWPSGHQARLHLRLGATTPLAMGLGEPDDVTVAPDGSVLYTDLRSNTVGQLLADGGDRTLLRGLSVPEGLAVLGPDQLLVAEQGTNRVLQWAAGAGPRPLLQLPVRRGVDGIDGLGSATIGGQAVALVPDSANGRMLLLRLDTLATTALPGRWQRPVAATVHAGRLYLVDEYGGRLWQGPPTGPLSPLGAALHLPDDVAVASDGSVFVNELSGSIASIRPNGDTTRPLSGLRNPQGLALDGAENLVIAESDSADIIRDVRSCAPLLVGAADLTLHAGGPALPLPLGSDCAPGAPVPTFSLAPGARWPAAGNVDWSAAGGSTATLPNGVVARLLGGDTGSALLKLTPPAARPPASGPTAILAVQVHVGSEAIPLQIALTVQG